MILPPRTKSKIMQYPKSQQTLTTYYPLSIFYSVPQIDVTHKTRGLRRNSANTGMYSLFPQMHPKESVPSCTICHSSSNERVLLFLPVHLVRVVVAHSTLTPPLPKKVSPILSAISFLLLASLQRSHQLVHLHAQNCLLCKCSIYDWRRSKKTNLFRTRTLTKVSAILFPHLHLSFFLCCKQLPLKATIMWNVHILLRNLFIERFAL